MAVEAPTRDELEQLARELGFALDTRELDAYLALCSELLHAHEVIELLPEPRAAIRYPRTPGTRPTADENPYNAWHRKTAIKGAPAGALAGRTVVLKDNIMLAGVPMMNGTTLLEGYVPDMDATVVTRVLDAGGEIAGKAHCEAFCLSAGSHTNATGPVHNPHRRGYSAGGSSSGCAVLVATGEVDMAIGGDQGGSIRIPSAACGTYGMKPTHGLVPYTGIVPIEPTIDHAGPMTRSVRDNALLLEVLAGADGYDSRQCAPVVHPYAAMLEGGVGGLRIGLVREGFGRPGAERTVEDKVRAAAALFGRLGATVGEVSIPLHLAGPAINGMVGGDGIVQTLLCGDGFGVGRSDLYPTSLIDFLHGWRRRAAELPATVKVAALLAIFVRSRHGVRYYAKAMNLARALTAEYDAALGHCDLLLMPTMPMTAAPLPGTETSLEELVRRAFEPVVNTGATNVTHHPALSVPCGMRDGLPVGMMLVGRRHDEPTIYRAAYAFEQAADWMAL